ncbi:hypothetical protein ADL29_40245 [Streptomyces chattanoogensis]|uniref:PKS/mFAS DH domain-containing protein n=1 Tax=Streptomyces chattanoogensis TaxID=66876 RepID=A0A0N0XQ57_9ACTN|nr:hypothetical protein ADL29_40245 [Streptomyces chattanoogensis]
MLCALAERWVDVLRRGDYDDTDMGAIAYTTGTGRTPMTERLACLVRTTGELREALESWLRGEPAVDVFRGKVPRGVELPDVPAGFGPHDDPTTADRRDWARLLQSWVDGAPVDWDRLHTGRHPRRIALPTYPFRLRRYWVDTTRPANGTNGTNGTPASALHPLVHTNTSDLNEHRYTSHFTGREFFLADHRVPARAGETATASDGRPDAVPVLPAVAYLEMARAAAVQAAGGDEHAWSLESASWLRPLVVDRATDVHTALTTRSGGGLDYEVYAEGDDGARVVFGRGRLRRATAAPAERLDLAALRAQCDGPVLDAETCYARLTGIGMAYGPALRGIERLHTGSRQSMARLKLPAAAARESGYVLHPAMLDAALHATLGLFADEPGTPRTALPYALGELAVPRAVPGTAWAVVRFAEDDHGGAVRRLDLDLCDDDGEVCVRLRGFSVRTADGSGTTADGEPIRPAAQTPEPPSGPDDAYLLDLIEAIGRREMSADEFKRSLA